MNTLNIQLLCRRSIDFPELAIFASRTGALINLHRLELPMARTLFHGPKDVRAIEVRLYLDWLMEKDSPTFYLIQRIKKKQQNGMCAQRRLRSDWASAQSDQILRCALSG